MIRAARSMCLSFGVHRTTVRTKLRRVDIFNHSMCKEHTAPLSRSKGFADLTTHWGSVLSSTTGARSTLDIEWPLGKHQDIGTLRRSEADRHQEVKVKWDRPAKRPWRYLFILLLFT